MIINLLKTNHLFNIHVRDEIISVRTDENGFIDTKKLKSRLRSLVEKRLLKKGYKEQLELPIEKEVKEVLNNDNYEKLTVAELKKLADKTNIKYSSKTTKAVLIKLLGE